jgi:TfoX/Sxy family transcriptional regulator of competence genes
LVGDVTHMSEIRGHLKEMVDVTALRLPAVTHRKMFGCDAWFSRGQIFSLIWKTGRVAVRLPEEAMFAQALALDGADVWSVAAKMKPMAHWVLLPEGFNDDEEEVAAWVKRAHVLAKPAVKASKAAAPKKKAKARK